MKLIIAEKHGVAKDIALAIPGECNFNEGYITAGEYTITWAVGHTLRLAEPQEIDPKYKDWKAVPFIFKPWPKVINEKTKKQYKVIERLLKQCDEVIHAGDPDDAGQLIVDEILRFNHVNKPVMRLSTNDNNHEVIRKALRRMKPNTEFESAGYAAEARQIADALFGMNLTRFYSNAQGSLLSIGRVQTPTLGLVVQRDHEIENHIKKYFYTLVGDFSGDFQGNIKLTYQTNKDADPVDENNHITDPKYFETLISSLTQRSGQIALKKAILSKVAPLPFNLTKLQTAANKQFGYSLQKTLDLTQALRDKHKAITYNRTDCQFLNEEHFKDAPQLTQVVQRNLGLQVPLNTNKMPRCFNNDKVSAHHAIIPTSKEINASDLSKDELNVYQLIAKYYLAQFMSPAKVEQTTAEIILDSLTFKDTGSKTIDPSWQALLNPKQCEEIKPICQMAEGQYKATLDNHQIDKKETKPPARYTDASLGEDMTRVVKYVQNEAVKALLLAKDDGVEGENGSIGTSATRSGIIEKLVQRKFLQRSKKQIISTQLGRDFYNALPNAVKSLDMTAYWWAIQDDIAKGEKTIDALIDLAYVTVTGAIDVGADSVKALKTDKPTKKEWKTDICPDCKQPIVLIESVSTPFWAHKDRETQCKTKFNNVRGKPVKRQPVVLDKRFKCPSCDVGFLQKRESKKKKGSFFWGCHNWQNGCKHIAWDDNGRPQEK